MTKLPSPFPITVAVIFATLHFLNVQIQLAHALGSGSTLAVSYASATVCGVVAFQSTHNIQCYSRGLNVSVQIQPNVSFSTISGGASFFCGLRTGGYSLLCWNPSNSTFERQRIYYNDSIFLNNLSVGDNQVCATTTTGVVSCWRGGDGNGYTRPFGVTQFGSISSGFGFSCGILAGNDTIRCWGSNPIASRIESEFGTMSMLSVQAGGSHVCGVNSTGFLVCKGDNSSGQLDIPVEAQLEYRELALGANHTCAIRNVNGSVVCWGGNGDYSVNLTNGVSFEKIVSGSDFTCGLTTANLSVLCWGPGWPDVSELPLPSTLPGPCVRSSCDDCGPFPQSEQLCSGSGSNGGANSNNSPISRSSTIRRQGSRAMRRQRSGTSSKHADRAEEFTLGELAAATNDFSLENKIGAGSFGIVYRGKLPDGREVAIKRGETGQKMKKFQEKETAFDSELAFLSRLHHKHLVRLVGYCEERDERLLVYDYMKNGALYDHLHAKDNVEKSSSVINSWRMRIKVALDAARGIEYLHNYAVPPIIHRDIKSSNILLDSNWIARVSDFGLSLMGPEPDRDYRPTKAAGTVGYIDPEYYGLNVLTAKSDVYGLGVVLLELLTGKRAIFKSGENGGPPISLVDFAVPAIMAGELVKILDDRVGPPELNEAEAVELVAYTAMHCVNLEGKDRPTMTDIVANLERALALCDHSHGSISSGTISIVSD
ncbi:putative serine/threonine-protein kinase-like protein CCR3 [Tripterygium wilfordii]|uniref:non-specific serine/threonine protein kinase n=1 Tax=Tripterygium wilfordii TaxID=458696 RepID=A0A7J7CR32_TRIWF|nr:putative serine/threonine-protein kinase-like protein CCR3 [Tripterygium wilfordii]